MDSVLTDEEMKLLSVDALHRLSAFLMELRDTMDKMRKENQELEQELEMALTCLKEDTVSRHYERKVADDIWQSRGRR